MLEPQLLWIQGSIISVATITIIKPAIAPVFLLFDCRTPTSYYLSRIPVNPLTYDVARLSPVLLKFVYDRLLGHG